VEAVGDGYTYADRIFGAAAFWVRSSPYVPTLVALGFATGFTHYALDRAAFRFSSPGVRHAARTLLQAPSVRVLMMALLLGYPLTSQVRLENHRACCAARAHSLRGV
jgi:hypothetical protein